MEVPTVNGDMDLYGREALWSTSSWDRQKADIDI